MTTKARSKQRIQIPDINILPEEYRRPQVTSQTLFLFLVVFVSAFAIYTLYPLRTGVSSEQTRIEDDLKAKQGELRILQALEPRVKELKEALAKLETRKKELLSSWETIQQSKVKWRQVLDGIQGVLPKSATIDALSQKESEITVRGIAPTLSLVQEYANNLRRLGLTSDLGLTYEVRPAGDVAFALRLVVKPGGER